MEGIHIGKFRLGGFRLKSWAISAVLLLLGLGNAMAGIFEWHNGVGMTIFNGVCVVALVVAVMAKIFSLEPRKRWRMLSFVLSAAGLLTVFSASFLESDIEPWLMTTLLIVGSVLLLLGGVSMVRWRRFSFERKADLTNSRQQHKKQQSRKTAY